MKKIKTSNRRSSKKQSANKSTSIDCLPDDCLFLIFSILGYDEGPNIEKVCKRWREVSLKLWSRPAVFNITYRNTKATRKLPKFNLEKVLRRGGKNVTELNFYRGAGHYDPDAAFSTISKYCKRLEHLEFSYCFGKQEINLNKISSSVARNLKGLYFLNDTKIKKASLISFLKKAVNLESFWLKSCRRVTNDALLNLSSSCTDLNLRSCKLNKRTYSKQLFQKLSNLQYLDVSRTNILPEALLSVSKNLVELTVTDCDKFFKGDTFKNLFMPNLHTLDVGWNWSVTDEVVAYFSTCFPALKDLNLEGCEKMNLDDSCRLQDCKYIEHLDISENSVTEFNFIHLITQMTDLKSLVADCDDFTESGLITTIKHLPKLEYIFVGETFKLTENFFKEILKFVKLRNYDGPFEIEFDFLEENAKIRKNILKDEIKRLNLKKETDLPAKSKCVVKFEDNVWYVESNEE